MEWNAKLWKESIHRFNEFMTPLVTSLGRSERFETPDYNLLWVAMLGEEGSWKVVNSQFRNLRHGLNGFKIWRLPILG